MKVNGLFTTLKIKLKFRKLQLGRHEADTHTGTIKALPSVPLEQSVAFESSQALTSLTIAEQLPPEILIQIFASLLAYLHVGVFAFALQQDYQRGSEHGLSRGGQSHLRSVAQVCRSWHRIACELLYLHPILMTHHRIRLFIRTLVDTPTLALLVRGMLVRDFQRARSYPTRLSAAEVVRAVRKTANHKATQKDLITVLTSSIGIHLRELALYGSFNYPHRKHIFLSPDSALPNLEVLRLKEVEISGDFRFPTLLNLRSLHIAHCRMPHYPIFPTLSISSCQMPSLEHVELYENLISFEMDQQCHQNLRYLHLVGLWHAHSDTLLSCRVHDEAPLLNFLCVPASASFFILDEEFEDFARMETDYFSWTLWFARILIWLDSDNNKGIYFFAGNLALLRALQFGLENKLGPFRRLTLTWIMPIQHRAQNITDEFDTCAEAVRMICAAKGIHLHETHTKMSGGSGVDNHVGWPRISIQRNR